MKKFKIIILNAFVMFGLFVFINSFTINAYEDDSIIDETIVIGENSNQDFDNEDVDVSTNVIVIEDDDNPDGVFLLGVKLKDNK